MKTLLSKTGKLLPLLAFAISSTAFAADSKPSKTTDGITTDFLNYKATPEDFTTAGPGIFTYEGNTFRTLNGREICKKGKFLIDADANPFGNAFFIISNEGSIKSDGVIVANRKDCEKLYEVNRKRLGNPLAAAYTADARTILLATDRGLVFLNAPDRTVQATMPEFKVSNITDFVPSANGYYLAVTSGSKLYVYNLEEKTLRKEMDMEVRINDVAFNDTSTELAVVTEDGTLSIFDTRNFLVKKTVDDLGTALSCSFNFDGKYIAVVTAPTEIVVINLLKTSDREVINVEPGVTRAIFVPNSDEKPLLVYNTTNAAHVRRMFHLAPFFGRLVNDEANERLNEWLKMMPGETMEQYRDRVNDESRERQRRLFEDEAATRLAPDMLSMAAVSLGKYDRGNSVLEIDFSNMPSIFLPVPETDLAAFQSGDGFTFNNAKYGVLSDDSFELIYAEVVNNTNGKTYIYNNVERAPLNFMADEDNVVSLELILQQQMEEQKLEEMRQKILEEAKSRNVITDHTNITVDTRIDPDYDSNGNKILNYNVNFSYEVDPGFTATEDFGPGIYHSHNSPAANAMLTLVKDVLEGDFAQYVKEGKKLEMTISGTADATPIVHRHLYDGSYGNIVEVPVYQDGKLVPMTIMQDQPITRNEELAFLRAFSVQDNLTRNIEALRKMNIVPRYNINVSEGKGSEYRRITLQLNFVDAL